MIVKTPRIIGVWINGADPVSIGKTRGHSVILGIQKTAGMSTRSFALDTKTWILLVNQLEDVD